MSAEPQYCTNAVKQSQWAGGLTQKGAFLIKCGRSLEKRFCDLSYPWQHVFSCKLAAVPVFLWGEIHVRPSCCLAGNSGTLHITLPRGFIFHTFNYTMVGQNPSAHVVRPLGQVVSDTPKLGPAAAAVPRGCRGWMGKELH